MTRPSARLAHPRWTGPQTAGRVLFLSHTEADGVFKVGSHHLAGELSKLGYTVMHVSTPYSAVHGVLRRGSDTRREQARNGAILDDAGVLHYVPSTFLPIQVSTHSTLTDIRNLMGGVKADFAFIDQPLFSARACTLARLNIYRPTDVIQGGVIGVRQRHLLRVVDGIIATSAHVLNALETSRDIASLVLPNGVDLSHFEPLSRDETDRRGVVYVGAIDERFDWSQLEAAAHANPQTKFDIYGPTPSRFPMMPHNVEVCGPIPYESLPRVLARYQVGILPLTGIPLNFGRSPMKLFEYLAAGLQVVATSTPTLQEQGRGVPGVHVVAEDEFAKAVESAVLNPLPEQDLIAEARRHTWTANAEAIAAFAQRLLASVQGAT
ncbi:glycosyltransferase [Mycolicibacterium aichiense]|nr:glycosyltransferase [Mycolicibacterium aichiense]MCV7016378.1 glycosyltransferase [Mycolicibacterium aichiense]STZ26484.1 glycosyltransferase, MSMEG_0565 family [Mycolicibacterium aichiense]